MIVDHDPLIQHLFDDAKQDLAAEAFVTQVMRQIDNQKRWAIAGWVCISLAGIICGWLLAPLLQDAISVVAQMLSSTLIDIGSGRLAQIFAPINSAAGVITLGLLGLRLVYKKVLFS